VEAFQVTVGFVATPVAALAGDESVGTGGGGGAEVWNDRTLP
jgi:hypothetical protein